MKTNIISLRRFVLAGVAGLGFFLARPGTLTAAVPSIYVTTENFTINGDISSVNGFTASGAAAGYTAPIPSNTYNASVAVDPVSNTLYLLTGNSIRTFNATTGVEKSIGFANATGFSTPTGILLAGGNLLVANYGGNNILAFNAATGAVATNFVSPAGLNNPDSLASNGTTLFVTNYGRYTVDAYNLATGQAIANFAPITSVTEPIGLTLYNNDLFVGSQDASTVGEFNALSGATINASFLSGVQYPNSLAVLGSTLLVPNRFNDNVGAYGIPANAVVGNVPTSSNPNFLTGLSSPSAITTVPEPSTWALLGAGVAGLGVVTLRRRRAVCA